MHESAVSVVDLKKRYRLGKRRGPSTLRDEIAQGASDLFQTMRDVASGRWKDPAPWIWALHGVEFEVAEGEVLGIVGPNGAGKSTLLKVLAGVTTPTSGYADIRGRVGSLLEVGTGFHQELTGRENIYMNGALLGMRRHEIKARFDEIVAFSEIDQFLDTPVKRYSSGMYMRLAFAVAAHLEPDVLIVDEVLAVGDLAFQKKCIGRMSTIAREGRTILFVSHNMAAVQNLCGRVVLIDQGRVAADGAPRKVIGRYLASMASAASVPLDQRTDRTGDGSVRITSVQVEDSDSSRTIQCGSCLRITISYRSPDRVRFPRFTVGIVDGESRSVIYGLDSEVSEGLPDELPAEGTVQVVTAPLNVTPGRLLLDLELLRGTAYADQLMNAAEFDVVAEDFFGSGRLPPRDWTTGLLRHEWSAADSK